MDHAEAVGLLQNDVCKASGRGQRNGLPREEVAGVLRGIAGELDGRASAETYALGLMVEEMGEVLKIIGKALRFGIDAPGPATPEYRGLTAREMLPFEIGDLGAAIKFAAKAGVVRMSAADLAEEVKLAKLLDPLSRDANGNRLAPDLSAVPQGDPSQ